MTIQIVQGQVLDLGFEGRDNVSPDDYLTMIELKTAVIVRFAAWAGARCSAERMRSAPIDSPSSDDRSGSVSRCAMICSAFGARPTSPARPRRMFVAASRACPILMLRNQVDASGRAVLQRLYDSAADRRIGR
ncbi:MAG: hypothetical protein R2845_02140 [Thermomicrobiales bacterium]